MTDCNPGFAILVRKKLTWRRYEGTHNIGVSLCENKNPAASYFPMTLTIIVSSALKGLTSVFGMGTGVSPSASPPETFSKTLP
jgi:hypothetical protein